MTTYAFDSEADFKRAARAIVRSERTPVNQPKKRARWQGGADGGGPKPYVITDIADVGGGQIQYDGGVPAKRLKSDTADAEPTDDDVTLAVGLGGSAMCIAKGNIVFAQSSGQQIIAADAVIVSGGIGTRLEGVCYEDIAAGDVGRVTITYPDEWETARDGTLFAYNVTGRGLAEGNTVLVDLGTVVHVGLTTEFGPTRFIVTTLLDC